MSMFYYSFNEAKKQLVIVKADGDKLEEFTVYPLRAFDIEFAYKTAEPVVTTAVGADPKPGADRIVSKPKKEKVAKEFNFKKHVPESTSRSGTSAEAKADAVERLNAGTSTADELAAELGVSSASIYNWRNKPAKTNSREVHGNEEWRKLGNADEFKAPVTEEQFDLIKDCMHQEMSALQTANELDIELAQVNYVYPAKTYSDYVRRAREVAGK